MILLKTAADIEQIRRVGRIVSAAHAVAASHARPGVELYDLVSIVAGVIDDSGAVSAFSWTDYAGRHVEPYACFGVNSRIGTPAFGAHTLRAGEIVNFDTGCRLEGWCAEAAWPYPVGHVDDERQRLVTELRRVFETLPQIIHPGATWADVSHRIARQVDSAGLILIPEIVGHGVGRELHEDPQLSWNPQPFGGVDAIEFRPGMVIAVECGITSGCGLLRPLPAGGWETYDRAPCVHGEMTLAVTDRGIDVLAGPIV